jgi:hypothetical protein
MLDDRRRDEIEAAVHVDTKSRGLSRSWPVK